MDAAILVYDITSERSFNSLSGWLYELKNKAPEKCIFYLVGNKKDLVVHDKGSRKVETRTAKAFAVSNNANFIETSALGKKEEIMPILDTLAN